VLRMNIGIFGNFICKVFIISLYYLEVRMLFTTQINRETNLIDVAAKSRIFHLLCKVVQASVRMYERRDYSCS
jgi:hypothetical protein